MHERESGFLITSEVARLLELAPSSVRGAAGRGALPGRKLAGWWAFEPGDVEAYDRRRRARPGWATWQTETEG